MPVATVNATLSQGTTSVSLPLLAPGGDILLSTDFGKPNLITHEGGTLFPRTQDSWSGLEQYNVLGRFRGSNAYQDARDLVDLVQADGDGNDMTFDVPDFPELPTDVLVAPAAEQDRALNITYPPGRRDTVDFDLGLTRVQYTRGSYDRAIGTPTASGSGPVTLSNGRNTVALDYGLTVDRYTGRPNDVVRRTPEELPGYEIKPKTVTDEFEISIMLTDDDAVTDTQDIADIFRSKQGRRAYSLDFGGLYGLGQFNVMPAGSQGLRTVRESGKEGVVPIPTINLRRVTV